MFKKLLIVPLILLLSLPAIAKHKEVLVTNCSISTQQEIQYIQSNMEKQGYEMPGNITCNTEEAKKIYETTTTSKAINFSKISGYYHPTLDLIYVQENSKNMSIPRILLHELGHYNHRLKLGDTAWNNVDDLSVPKRLQYMISIMIRDYANYSRKEYVAEYFAMTQLGETFPKEMQDLYTECQGP